MTPIWVAGYHLGGYLPDTSPYLTADWESAREYLLDALGYNGLLDYYHQGLSQSTLDAIDQAGSATALRQQFTPDDDELDTFMTLIECEKAIDSLRNANRNEEWSARIGDYYYWIELSDRSSNDIPEDLEGDELLNLTDELNESC